MSIKIKIYWQNANSAHESVCIYRANSEFSSSNLPPVLVEVSNDVAEYEDRDLIENKTYFYMLSSKLGDDELFTKCFSVVATPASDWTPDNAVVLPTYWFDAVDSNIVSPTEITVSSKVGSYLSRALNCSLSVDNTIVLNSSLSEITSSDLKDFLVSKDKFFVFIAANIVASNAAQNLFMQYLPDPEKYNALSIRADAGGDLSVNYRRLSTNSNISIVSSSIFQFGSIDLVLVQFDMVSNSLSIHVNGIKVAIGAPGATPLVSKSVINSLVLGRGINGSEMKIAETIGCNSGVLDQSDIDKYFGWAAHKYGVSYKLPGDHPYKNTAPTI